MSAWRHLSLWMNQLDDPLEARPSLEESLEVDVAIVGAGYTGLWTAYYLKRRAPQLRVAIVEAETAGFGASGRNGGWLMGNLLGEDGLLAGLPPERRRAGYDLLHGIPDEVARVLQEEGIDCDYRKAACSTARRATRNRNAACAPICMISMPKAWTKATTAG